MQPLHFPALRSQIITHTEKHSPILFLTQGSCKIPKDMSEKAKVEKRKITGKKVKKLRQQEILPANLYGKEMKSQAIQIPIQEFKDLFEKVGETGIVEVDLEKEKIPALIHNVHVHPLTKEPLHADFLKINLKEKITAQIPLEFTGEPQAVKDNLGSFMHPISEIEVEALPTDLPESIEVNVDELASVGDQILVKDITAPQGVEIKNEEGDVIAMIAEIKEEPEPEPEPIEGEEGEGESDEDTEKAEGEESTESADSESESTETTEEKKE